MFCRHISANNSGKTRLISATINVGTGDTIASVAGIANALKSACIIDASGIVVTIMCVIFTLIDVSASAIGL